MSGLRPDDSTTEASSEVGDLNLDDLLLADHKHWRRGPPHELFDKLRTGCPVHWTDRFSAFPDEAGFWSVTTFEDVRTVSRDSTTFSSERGGVAALTDAILPLELQRAMFIGMDPPSMTA